MDPGMGVVRLSPADPHRCADRVDRDAGPDYDEHQASDGEPEASRLHFGASAGTKMSVSSISQSWRFSPRFNSWWRKDRRPTHGLSYGMHSRYQESNRSIYRFPPGPVSPRRAQIHFNVSRPTSPLNFTSRSFRSRYISTVGG